MYPIALEFGAFSIRFYGVMAALGFIAAVYLMDFNRKFSTLNKDQCSTMLLIALVCGVAGARIFYFVQFYEQFRGEWWRIIRIDQGGLVFYGGFLLALAAVIIYALKCKADPVRVLDALAPAMAAAHGFGRIGCFLNGCCYGRPTEMWWGIRPVKDSVLEAVAGNLPLHPVQLVEAGENFILCILYCYLLRHTKRGVTVSCFFIFYGVLRFFNEMMRGDNVLYFKLTPAQWIGIALVPAGIIALICFLRNGKQQNN